MHPDRLNGHSNPSVGVEGRFEGFFTARLIKLTVPRASIGPRVSPSQGPIVGRDRGKAGWRDDAALLTWLASL